LFSEKKEPNYASEDFATCSECGKEKDVFRNKAEFLNHVGVCDTINDTSKPAKKTREILNEEKSEIDDALQRLSSGTMVVLDGTEVAANNGVCVYCKKSDGQSVECACCHCNFHSDCLTVPDSDSDVCEDCLKVGLSADDDKVSKLIPGDWVYVYFPHNIKWKRSMVLAKDPSRETVALVKIHFHAIDPDKLHNPYYWVDISKKDSYRINIHNSEEDEDDSEGERLEQPKRKRRRRNALDTPKDIMRGGEGSDDENAEEDRPKRRRKTRGSSEAMNLNTSFSKENNLSDSDTAMPTKSNESKRNNTFSSPKNNNGTGDVVMTDTYVSANSLKAALCASGTVCRAIDIVMTGNNVNAFACIRPPGHHCGRNGCTKGSISTGFCLLNNAAIGLTYARVFWGLKRVAIVDIDVHFGNGTAEIVKDDPNTFFASIHMIYGPKNDGNFCPIVNQNCGCGFYPTHQGLTEVSDHYVSVGVFPADIYAKECSTALSKFTKKKLLEVSAAKERDMDDTKSESIRSLADNEDKTDEMSVDENTGDQTTKIQEAPSLPVYAGPTGYISGLRDLVIPKLIAFQPELLIISGKTLCFLFPVLALIAYFSPFVAGFDGYASDPLGGEMNLSTQDYHTCTRLVRKTNPLFLFE
jgi:acetoin utilization deacetylase AcuC-like enzyme